jgi:hypothetical protein
MQKFILGLACLSVVAASSANADAWRPAHRIVRVHHNGVDYSRPVGWTYGSGWRWAATVEGDWMIGLGQLRLQTAQAWLVQAQAAYQWQKVRQLRALVNFQINELKALQRTKYNLLMEAKRFEARGEDLDTIVSGHLRPATYAAILFFMKQPNVDPTAIAEVRVEAIRADGAFYHSSSASTKPIEDFAGGNLIELVEFLRKNNYNVRPGSAPWVELNKLRTLLVEKGEEVLDEVVSRYESLKDGSYDAWEPLAIHSNLVDFEGKDPKEAIK